MGTIKMKEAVKEAATNVATEEVAQTVTAAEFGASAAVKESAGVLREEESLRGTNSKCWKMNNGTMRQVISSNALHFKDKSGKMQEIDNNLAEKENGFEASMGERKITFAKEAGANNIMKIEKEGVSISWKPIKAKALEKKSVMRMKSAVAPIGIRAIANANKDVTYENISDGVDLEYSLTGSNVKENIIVKEQKEEYRYEFELETAGLNVRLSEDNRSIELINAQTGEREYTIPEPYMYDATGDKNDEVYYEVEKESDDKYYFAVVAEPAWINAPERTLPVTIDPEFVTNQTYLFSNQVWKTSCSTSEIKSVSSKYIKVDNSDLCDRYYSTLTINKKNFPLVGQKISKVLMTLTPYRVYISGNIRIGNKTYQCSANKKIEVDITNEFNRAGEFFSINVTALGNTKTDIHADGLEAPTFAVEYINEYIKPCKKRFALAGNASGIFNVPTGELVTEIPVASGTGLSLNYGISLIYKPSGEKLGCGDNFRLNLNEKLEKNSDAEDKTQANYIYTDSYGDKYGFDEYFYYIDDDNAKHYVDKENVTVNTDGSLKDDDDNVIYREEHSATGLRAITQLEGVKNAEWFEQRQEELKQLQERKEAYENALKDFVIVNNLSGQIKYELKNYLEDSNAFTSFTDKITDTMSLMHNSEAIQYRNLKLQIDSIADFTNNIVNILPEEKGFIPMRIMALESAYYEITKSIRRYLVGYFFKTATSIVSSIYPQLDREVFRKLDNREIIDNNWIEEKIVNNFMYEQGYYDGEDIEIIPPEMSGITLKTQLRQRNLYLEQLKSQYEELQEQGNIVDAQMYDIVAKSNQNKKQMQQYYTEYVKLKDVPVDYLTDNNIVKGFNEEGELVAICDRYENIIMIERNGKLITRVYDSKGNEITFKYNSNGLLKKITDVRGRITKFEYDKTDKNKLNKLTYSGKKTLSWLYQDSQIARMESSEDKMTVMLLYSETQLQKIGYNSMASEISHGNYIAVDKPINNVSVVYEPKETNITTDDMVTERYRFNDLGNCTEYYLEENGLVTKAEQYDFEKYKKDNVTYAKNSELYKKPLKDFVFNVETIEKVELNLFNNPVKKEIFVDAGALDSTKTNYSSVTEYAYDDNQLLISEKTALTITYPNNPKSVTHTAIKTYNYNAQGNVVRSESYIVGEELTNGKSIEETVYDDKGNAIKSFTYNSLDTSSKFYSESEYAENGQVTAEIDETGENKTKLEYVDGTDMLKSQTLPNGSKLSYGHDESDNITAITQSTEEGEENSTQTAYTFGQVTELKSGNNTVRYSYDYKRRKKAVYLNDNENAYVTYDYTDKTIESGKTVNKVVATLKNKDRITATEDLNGNLLNSKYEKYNVAENTYTETMLMRSCNYNAKNQIKEIIDGITNKITSYAYDFLDRLSNYKADNVTETYSYNNDGNVETKTLKVDGKTVTYNYDYNDNFAKDLKSISVGAVTVSPKFDILGRNTGKEIVVNGEKVAEEYIAYRKVGDHATNMPSAMRFGNRVVTPSGNNVTPSDSSSVTPSAAEGSKTQFVRLDNLKYAYDSCGNISEIRENGELAVRYSYDKLNRLVCEDNRQLNIITWFTYDNNGNILSKRVKSADSDEKTLYGYDGDRLLCFGNETFEYDVLGNPTTYRGKKCVWQRGRQLSEYDTDGAKITFTYDGQGRRISKGSTNYTYDGSGNLIKQTDGTNTLEFFYDNSGVIGFEHTANNDTKTYIYRRNAQGDIIALLDKNGNVVVKYVYDAWGNHEIHDTQDKVLKYKENDEENNKLYTIADLNPFRYRGYYYDTETKLYYLKSRYYDPEVGRFITIDGIRFIYRKKINGLNLYVYCADNPIKYIDPAGTSIKDKWNDFWRRVGVGAKKIWDDLKNDWKDTANEVKELPDKIVETGVAIIENISINLGIGLGLGFSFDLLGFFSLSLMYKGDFLSLLLDRMKLKMGGAVNQGLEISLFKILNLSLGINIFSDNWETDIDDGFASFGVSIGGGAYLIVGGSFEIGIDIKSFWSDFKEIWGI